MDVSWLSWLLGAAAAVFAGAAMVRLHHRSRAEDAYFYGGSRDED